jgi:hypothetical protein
MPTATTVALRRKPSFGAAGCWSGVISEVMRLLFCWLAERHEVGNEGMSTVLARR